MIRRIKPRISTVLPTSFGETLSYIEELGKCIAKLNEVIEAQNALQTETAAKIEELDEFREDIENQFVDFKNEVRETLDTAAVPYITEITIEQSAWFGKTATINGLDVRSTDIVIIVPKSGNEQAFNAYDIKVGGISTGEITFVSTQLVQTDIVVKMIRWRLI